MPDYGMMPRIKRVERMPRQEDLEAYYLTKAGLEAAKMAYTQAWSEGIERGMNVKEVGSYATDMSREAEREARDMLRKWWRDSGIIQAGEELR